VNDESPTLWTYLFVYSPELGTDQEVQRAIDENRAIVNWHKCLPNSLFLVSYHTAGTLAETIKRRLGSGRFFIVDTDSDRSGWLPRKVWESIIHPTGYDE
jgi:hypothetical protein